jgi:outer membrane protein OmpA-like peptidoglycan-associated protein
MSLRLFTCLACLFIALPLAAQTTAPSTQQMIDQLKVPRMRGMRNLSVESVPVSESTHLPRPSLSLLINFDLNSTTVKPESQEALGNLSQAMLSKELMNSRFAIEGHTDAKGSAAYNLELSQKRAQSVADFLVTKGVTADRLDKLGKGFSELANPQQPLAPENRRVRIVTLD